jgi:transcriptional regulator with XRE-family HTH domain
MARTPKAQALGVALRRAREGQGLSTRDLGDRIERNQGEISRWETGDRAPKPEHVAQVLTALGITGRTYDEIMSLAHDIGAPLWVATTLPAQRQQLAAFVEMEESASMVTEVSPMLIPGLLQTRDYAQAIMSGGDLSADDVVTRVAVRMGRRDSITRADPIKFIAFIGEAAIHQTIGDQAVMVAQYRHLLEMAQRPNIVIRIMRLDSGWQPGLEGAFTFFIPEDQVPIVHIELRRTSTFLHAEDDVSAYKRALDMIDKVALAPGASAQLITARMESLS